MKATLLPALIVLCATTSSQAATYVACDLVREELSTAKKSKVQVVLSIDDAAKTITWANPETPTVTRIEKFSPEAIKGFGSTYDFELDRLKGVMVLKVARNTYDLSWSYLDQGLCRVVTPPTPKF